MSSKYADLPDIDTQPDTYETEDVNEEVYLSTKNPVQERADEDVVKDSVPPEEAANVFRSKVGDLESNNPETELKNRTAALCREYIHEAIIVSGETKTLTKEGFPYENPMQKLRRLAFEVGELSSQLEKEHAFLDNQDSLSLQITELQNNLARMSAVLQPKGQLSLKFPLLSPESSGNRLVGSQSELNALQRMLELEKRVSFMEKTLGNLSVNGASGIQHSNKSNLLCTVSRLEEQLKMLAQPRQLDNVSRKLKTVNADLEKLLELKSKEAEASGISAEAGKKIDSLFSLSEKIDEVVPLMPHLAARLRSLQDLHAEALAFGDAIKQVSSEQSRIDSDQHNLTDILTKLENSFKENLKVVEENMKTLESRIHGLANTA